MSKSQQDAKISCFVDTVEKKVTWRFYNLSDDFLHLRVSFPLSTHLDVFQLASMVSNFIHPPKGWEINNLELDFKECKGGNYVVDVDVCVEGNVQGVSVVGRAATTFEISPLGEIVTNLSKFVVSTCDRCGDEVYFTMGPR